MKKAFTEDDLALWYQIVGKQGFGFTTADIQNAVDILEGELGLVPVVYTLLDEPFVWDDLTRQKFYNLDARHESFSNGSWRVIYYPDDCEKSTGSNRNNWTQWGNTLLKHGRKDHPFAPKFSITKSVRTLLERRGHELSGRSKGRGLSLEVVVFILARQDRTWSNPGAVLEVRRRLRKMNPDFVMTHFSALADDEEGLDNAALEALFGADDDDGVSVTMAGQGDLDDDVDDIIADLMLDESPETIMPTPAPIAPVEPIPSTSLREVDEFASVSEDDLEAQIAKMTAALERKRALASEEARLASASQMEVLGGDVYGDQAYYRTVEVRYPDGSIRTLYDEEALPMGKVVQAVKK